MKPWKISVIASFVLCFAIANVQALTIGYPVEVENTLPEPVDIELSQYHASGFNGDQPEEFTEDLLNKRTQITLKSGEKRNIKYSSAGGGFWLLWRVTSPPAFSDRSGMLRFIEGEFNILIE